MEDRSQMQPAMSVNNLRFAYGKNQILKNISFTIKEKKITTILGANGSGKSTLFSLMTKNLHPQHGMIYLRGENIKTMNLKEFSKKVSIVHQYNTASDDITVERLISYGRTPHQTMLSKNHKEDERLVHWAMEVTNTAKYKEKEMSKLSGGQRQRVWIAMALAQNTKILLLDEPTTYLDIRYQIEILELIQKLNRDYGITIIMILHDINHAIHFSDYIIGLKEGQMVVSKKSEEFVSQDNIQKIYGIRLEVKNLGDRKYVIQERCV